MTTVLPFRPAIVVGEDRWGAVYTLTRKPCGDYAGEGTMHDEHGHPVRYSFGLPADVALTWAQRYAARPATPTPDIARDA